MESQTLIEIEGGIFIHDGGRHSRGAGYTKEAEKYLEAALADWTVLRLTEGQLEVYFIERIVALLRQSSSSEEIISGRSHRTK
jgi:hypothetical protein